MDSIKEIRNHIDSVQQTLKITNAMYLISSSKLRKAREQLTNVQPYFVKTTQTISDILHRTQDVEHIYFDRRPGKPHKAGFIIITGDKGLAGAYNHNVLRLAEEHMQKFDDPTLFLVGQTGRSYFRHKGVTVDVEFMYTAQDPTPPRAREIADLFVEHFRKGRLDEVYVVYTELVTPLPQAAAAGPRRLPLAAAAAGRRRHPARGDVYALRRRGAQPHRARLPQGRAVRRDGGVLLLRAERPHDGHGHRHRERPQPAQTAFAGV